MSQSTNLDTFTNKFNLQKTLPFRLVPEDETKVMLDQDQVFEQDQTRREKYLSTKPWLDKLHRDFVHEALSDFNFTDLNGYENALRAWQKNKKDEKTKKALQTEEQKLRDEIVKAFDKHAAQWSEDYHEFRLKKKTIDILLEESALEILEKRYGGTKGTLIQDESSGDMVSIFTAWKGFTGAYFLKFFETRRNFYKTDGTSTAIATRIVDQNLRRFFGNIDTLKKISNKISFTEVEQNFFVDVDQIFMPDFYAKCLLQEGIDTYNSIIGGVVRENGEKLKGVNELINKYHQDNKGEKLPRLSKLDKQILSEKDSFVDSIESDKELFERLAIFYDQATQKTSTFRSLINELADNIDTFELDKIFISKEAITHNSRRWFTDYEVFEKALFTVLKQHNDEYEALRQDKRADSKLQEKDGEYAFPDFLKLSHIAEALGKVADAPWSNKYADILPTNKQGITQFIAIFKHELEQQFNREEVDKDGKLTNVGLDIFKQNIADLLSEKPETVSAQAKIDIKNFADQALRIYQIGKYFATEKKRKWLTHYDHGEFYKNPEFGFELFYQDAFEQIVQPYNLLRNYLTRKPFNIDKWKLNFNNPSLAGGWDKNEETTKSTVILHKDGTYYLGIMRNGYRNIFSDKFEQAMREGITDDAYEKMEYKYTVGVSRSIPKSSTQVKAVISHFKQTDSDFVLEKGSKVGAFVQPLSISRRIFDLNNRIYAKNGITDSVMRWDIAKADEKNYVKAFQKEYVTLGGDVSIYRSALSEWIDFCKEFLATYPSTALFDFSHLKTSHEYKSLDEFYKDVDDNCYQLIFKKISASYVQKINKEHKLYLFKIHNKDWNSMHDGSAKTGTKNLHTLYWEEVFSGENRARNYTFKLNGGAELFFRPKTLDAENKLGKTKDGKIRHKRYAQDTVLFHCPVDINRTSGESRPANFNAEVRQFLSNNPDINIIGIDRGEKHLAYYAVIKQDGTLIEVDTLNNVGRQSNGKKIPFAKKLEQRAKEREAARRDWQDIENIKDLKQGYISQVVRKLADLMIEHNAIIVFEDLNMRFKQVRGGIEKSVYQQLEKALIDKLAYLVDKKQTDPQKAGHLLRAYQLAAPVTAFKDMGKQTGFIFYTQAGYTSKTCPQCGFRRNIKCQFENINKSKQWFANLKKFAYDPNQDAFTIAYERQNFLNKEQLKPRKIANELFADISAPNDFLLTTKNAIRYKWVTNNSPLAKTSRPGVSDLQAEEIEAKTRRGVTKKFDITQCIKSLLQHNDIDINSVDVAKTLATDDFDKNVYQNIMYYIHLLTEIRQSISGQPIDYIHCPSCLFDSRDGLQGHDFDSDANGAYNIARKGKLILDKISQYKGEVIKMSWSDFSINIEEWDKFTQN